MQYQKVQKPEDTAVKINLEVRDIFFCVAQQALERHDLLIIEASRSQRHIHTR